MKTVLKNARPKFVILFFLIELVSQVSSGFTASKDMDCDCGTVAYNIASQTSNSVSFTWSPVSGSTAYRVWYYRAEDNYTSAASSVGSTIINFSSLPAGTYKFYFQTICGDNSSQIIITDDLLMG